MNKFKHYYYNTILKESDTKDGVYDYDLNLDYMFIKELPSFFKDIRLENNVIYINGNLLTTFKNFPKNCYGIGATNNKLTSLEGVPMLTKAHSFLDLGSNNISELGDSLSKIKVLRYLTLERNPLLSLKGLEHLKISSSFAANYTKIKNLKYCPNPNRPMDVDFDFSNCEIESLEGCPESIEYLHLYNNKIKSLEGLQPPNSELNIFGNDPEISKQEVMDYLDLENISETLRIFAGPPER